MYYKVRTERDVETVIVQHDSPDDFVFPTENLGFNPAHIIKQQGVRQTVKQPVKRQGDEPLESEAKKPKI